MQPEMQTLWLGSCCSVIWSQFHSYRNIQSVNAEIITQTAATICQGSGQAGLG